MRKILLTSSGFETKSLQNIFLNLIGKKPEEIKALFIPTAAIDPDAIAVLPKCMNDLLKIGILPENIKVFDLHCNMDVEELSEHDAVYFTGGSTKYLLERINDTDFDKSLKQYVDNGGVYVGVSAGSVAATNNLPDNLGFINCTLKVHMSSGTQCGLIDVSQNPQIELTGETAILIFGDRYEVVE